MKDHRRRTRLQPAHDCRPSADRRALADLTGTRTAARTVTAGSRAQGDRWRIMDEGARLTVFPARVGRPVATMLSLLICGRPARARRVIPASCAGGLRLHPTSLRTRGDLFERRSGRPRRADLPARAGGPSSMRARRSASLRPSRARGVITCSAARRRHPPPTSPRAWRDRMRSGRLRPALLRVPSARRDPTSMRAASGSRAGRRARGIPLRPGATSRCSAARFDHARARPAPSSPKDAASSGTEERPCGHPPPPQARLRADDGPHAGRCPRGTIPVTKHLVVSGARRPPGAWASRHGMDGAGPCRGQTRVGGATGLPRVGETPSIRRPSAWRDRRRARGGALALGHRPSGRRHHPAPVAIDVAAPAPPGWSCPHGRPRGVQPCGPTGARAEPPVRGPAGRSAPHGAVARVGHPACRAPNKGQPCQDPRAQPFGCGRAHSPGSIGPAASPLDHASPKVPAIRYPECWAPS